MDRCFFTGAAAPHKSDGGGAPSLPWGHEGRFRAVGAVAPFEKQMVGPPRRRGTKIQARMRRCLIGAATPRKSDGGGAPSLPWEHEGRYRAAISKPLQSCKFLLIL